MTLASFTKLKDMQNGTYYYIPFNPNFVKVELVHQENRNSNEKGKFVGIRVYLSLNTPVSLVKNSTYTVRIQKIKEDSDVVPTFYLQTENFVTYYNYLKPYIELGVGIGGDLRNLKNSLISYDEILKLNSSKEDKEKINAYTIPYFLIPSEKDKASIIINKEDKTEQELLQLFNRLVINPDDTILVSLYDFSSIKIDYSFKNKDGKTISASDAETNINDIISNSGIDPVIANKLKIAFNINKYLTVNGGGSIIDKAKNLINNSDFNMGAILWGPPGTGKTHTVRKVFLEIFENVFGYNIIDIKAKDLEQNSQYYGARQRAVNAVFEPALKKVQSNYRPCFIFVDEGDKIIQKEITRDDNEGIAAIKNYLNTISYPGLILCVNTNLDQVKLDPGILTRRLMSVEYGYPNLETAKNVWKEKIETDVFKIANKENREPKFYTLNNGNKIQEELNQVYTLLAQIVAGNTGLDSIDTFTKNYRNSNFDQEINFTEFSIEFYKVAIQRIKQMESSEIADITSNRHNVNPDAIEKIKQRTRNEIDRLTAALKRENELEIEKKRVQIINDLKRSDKNNLYYLTYIKLHNNYRNININSSEINFNIYKELFDDSNFLLNYIKQGIIYINPNNNLENFLKLYTQNLEIIREYSSKILLKHGDNNVLITVPELIGINQERISREEETLFFVNVADFLKKNTPENLFNLEEITTQIDLNNNTQIENSNRNEQKESKEFIKEFENMFAKYKLFYFDFFNKVNKLDNKNKLKFYSEFMGILTQIHKNYFKYRTEKFNLNSKEEFNRIFIKCGEILYKLSSGNEITSEEWTKLRQYLTYIYNNLGGNEI